MPGNQDDSKDKNKSSVSVPVLTNFGPNTDANIHKITPPPYNPAVKSDTSVNSSLVSHSLYPDLQTLTTLAAVVDHNLDSYVYRPRNEQQPDSSSSAAATFRPPAAESATSAALQQQQSLKVEDSSNSTAAQLLRSF
ncbi:hypothetical protein GOODEAATRI_034017 [Goodea atripinnis]|uniref:Uncharacterized protein n=1 Tax=Goodea atripinnis TaxID=208336 RepID=A0ABV0PJD9_9TELE